jgi:rod shape-determining protein MreC
MTVDMNNVLRFGINSSDKIENSLRKNTSNSVSYNRSTLNKSIAEFATNKFSLGKNISSSGYLKSSYSNYKYLTENNSSKKSLFIIALVLFFLSLLLAAYTRDNKYFPSILNSFYLRTIQPLTTYSVELIRTITEPFRQHLVLVEVKKENTFLKNHIAALRTKVQFLEELQIENANLKDLFNEKSEIKIKTKLARVVSRGSIGWSHNVIINKGSDQGVKIESAVINQDGLIGFVASTTSTTSSVLLLSDPRSAVDVRMQKSRQQGIAFGTGLTSLDLKFLPTDTNALKGELVVTSGKDGIYPAGLIVGKINNIRPTESLFTKVEVAPMVDFSRLEQVLICSVE